MRRLLVTPTSIANALLCVVALAAPARSAAPARFFIMGDGNLALVNGHTDERVRARYRQADGNYDAAALSRIRRLFRSRTDQREGVLSLRLVEVLSALQQRARVSELVLVSGYRSPQFNDALRRDGKQAAGGSLHTEGLAADLAFPRPRLAPLWHALRDLDCCGVGLYERESFLHVDVGRPRFWEAATSRVSENLSAGNARLFARTEFDRYRREEPIVVTLHAMTVPPVAIARAARLVPTHGPPAVLQVEREGDGAPPAATPGATARAEASPDLDRGCLTMMPGDRLTLQGAVATARARIELATCEPRSGRTPATVETNPVDIE